MSFNSYSGSSVWQALQERLPEIHEIVFPLWQSTVEQDPEAYTGVLLALSLEFGVLYPIVLDQLVFNSATLVMLSLRFLYVFQ